VSQALPAPEIGKVIRRRVLQTVRRYRRRKVAIALSGGVDSCSILAAMLENDMCPKVVSYTPDTHVSTDFQMAQAAAGYFMLPFTPAIVNTDPYQLESDVRIVLGLGYTGKVEVECLTPLVTICRTAAEAGVRVLFTGDQADGYFVLSKWASHNADRAAGVPRGQRTNVQRDTTPGRIDHLRDRYWELDKSCSKGVQAIGRLYDLDVVVPYRDEAIKEAFRYSLWSEINRPRFKEPIRLAFEEMLADIPTRPLPVNLHKGDSRFAEILSTTLMALPHLRGRWRTPRGLYSAMARGEA
jgi:asparagine synthetase B (glutamine-hydrolysing)